MKNGPQGPSEKTNWPRDKNSATGGRTGADFFYPRTFFFRGPRALGFYIHLYKNLYKSVFENLNSKTLANTISNAWQEMTEESSRLNLFINELEASIDE